MKQTTSLMTSMSESLKRNGKGILLMAISACSLSIGPLLWKMVEVPVIQWSNIDWMVLIGFLVQLIPGFIVYMIGAIFMIMAFRFGELSVLQPMNSMSYVFSLILAVGILHETVTPFMIIGVILIMIGVFFIGGSSK